MKSKWGATSKHCLVRFAYVLDIQDFTVGFSYRSRHGMPALVIWIGFLTLKAWYNPKIGKGRYLADL